MQYRYSGVTYVWMVVAVEELHITSLQIEKEKLGKIFQLCIGTNEPEFQMNRTTPRFLEWHKIGTMH